MISRTGIMDQSIESPLPPSQPASSTSSLSASQMIMDTSTLTNPFPNQSSHLINNPIEESKTSQAKKRSLSVNSANSVDDIPSNAKKGNLINETANKDGSHALASLQKNKYLPSNLGPYVIFLV